MRLQYHLIDKFLNDFEISLLQKSPDYNKFINAMHFMGAMHPKFSSTQEYKSLMHGFGKVWNERLNHFNKAISSYDSEEIAWQENVKKKECELNKDIDFKCMRIISMFKRDFMSKYSRMREEVKIQERESAAMFLSESRKYMIAEIRSFW